MTDPEIHTPAFWKKMGRKFLKIDPKERLWISWAYFPSSQHHFFFVDCDAAFPLIRAKFEAEVARAGRIINSSDPFKAWLIALKRIAPNDRPGHDLQFEPETTDLLPCISGIIHKPCEFSAVLCAQYERRAIEKASASPPTAATQSKTAGWLADRLKDRGWDHNTLEKFNGPDRKTTLKVLAGKGTTAKVLKKIVDALNSHNKASKVSLDQIPK